MRVSDRLRIWKRSAHSGDSSRAAASAARIEPPLAQAAISRPGGCSGRRPPAPAPKPGRFVLSANLGVPVQGNRIRAPEVVDLHGVVEDELDGLGRIDAVGIAAERHDRVAHGRQVDNAGYAREVLEQDPQ